MKTGNVLISTSNLKSVIGSKLSIHITLLMLLNIISFTVLNREYHEQKTRILNNYSAIMQSKVEASLGVFKKFSHYVYQQISQDTQVMTLFKQAVESPGPVRDASRQKIYQLLKPNYDLLKLVSMIYAWNIYSEHVYKKKLMYLSNTDFLTKLFNRNKFTENLTFEFVKYRESNGAFSVVLFDIDHFKRINDSLGHNIGDAYLKELSELIASKVRHSDTFARWGGEEFIVLLPSTPESSALKVAELLRKQVESHQFSSPQRITISLGVAEVNDSDKSIDDVIARADKALYDSKDAGRNKATAWSETRK